MAVFAHEIEDMHACTGKPQELGGIPHELGTTGYGVSVALDATLDFLKGMQEKGGHEEKKPVSEVFQILSIKREDMRVTIQGFGNVGSFTAKFLNDLKIRVVGVSDVSGFVYDRNGLDIPQLMKDMKGKEKLADLSEIKNGPYSYDISDKDRIFEVGADVFIPAAMTGVINDRTAPKILDQGIKVIVEAANIPTTPSADQYLIGKGLLLIPDFLANSGGVIGSFVEYQGRTEKEAFDLISYKIAKNVKQSLADSFLKAGNDSTKDPEVNIRKVATESSKQKVYRAMLLRKGAINVAREAYARK